MQIPNTKKKNIKNFNGDKKDLQIAKKNFKQQKKEVKTS